jgi:hypothetical protein
MNTSQIKIRPDRNNLISFKILKKMRGFIKSPLWPS